MRVGVSLNSFIQGVLIYINQSEQREKILNAGKDQGYLFITQVRMEAGPSKFENSARGVPFRFEATPASVGA